MLERQVEEHAVGERIALVEAAGDRLGRDLAGARIAEERLGLAAEDIARELVEQQQQGERAVGRGSPVVEPAHLRLMHQRTEARADVGVECRVLLEPELARPVGEPEFQDVARRAHQLFFWITRCMAGRAATRSARRFTFGKRS